ncbi:unnamed protein product [Lupinus luteus]|uniref:Uncharacterized protein n=1 Tax=Lupinus luteus TaxID=3873 RepID=A0AAV1XXC3_LUPLU
MGNSEGGHVRCASVELDMGPREDGGGVRCRQLMEGVFGSFLLLFVKNRLLVESWGKRSHKIILMDVLTKDSPSCVATCEYSYVKLR